MGDTIYLIAILSVAVIIHELGHYTFAQLVGVTAVRASLFFNLSFTFLKYDPVSGRLSLFSQKVPVKSPYSPTVTYFGEKSFLSFQVHSPVAPDFILSNNELRLCTSTEWRKTFVKQRPTMNIATWRKTQYCIGWLPFGGYVTFDMDDTEHGIASKPELQQLMVNAAGVLFNIVTMLLALLILRLIWATESTGICDTLAQFAYVSFGLTWLNILPLPGLDGGNIMMNIINMFRPSGTKILQIIYNIFGFIVFAFIISTWFRPAMHIETAILNFFNSIFDKLFCWIVDI